MKLETICPAVWDHLCVNTTGKNRLCCNAKTQDNDKLIKNFDNHWNEFRNGVKEEMLKGNKPEVCAQCWKKEDLGLKSLRKTFIDRYQRNNLWEDYLYRIDKDVKNLPTELDLKLGNFCNLSCRMCNGQSSSKYLTELKKIVKDKNWKNIQDWPEDSPLTGLVQGDELDLNVTDWYDSPKFEKLLYKFIDNGLKLIKFTGGEPLMVPNAKKIIEYCIAKDKAKDLELMIITNMTLLNDEWLQLFSYFKHVSMNMSIDGVGKTYEYIRHPSSWETVYENLKTFSNFKNTAIFKKIVTEGDRNFTFTSTSIDKTGKDRFMIPNITFTFSVLNILEVDQIVYLRRELGFLLNIIPVLEPAYLDVKYAPESLKKEAISRCKKLLNDIKLEDEKIFIENCITKISENVDESEAKVMQKRVIAISQLKDGYRGQSFFGQTISRYYV